MAKPEKRNQKDRSGLTPQMEFFCQRYLEVGNASQAYRLCYDASGMKATTVHRKAKELLDNGKITARLDELRKKLVEEHDLTINKIISMLLEDRALAYKEGQAGAAIRSTELLGKHIGMWQEKIRVDDWRSDIIKAVRDGVIDERDLRQAIGDEEAERVLAATRL